MPFQILCQGQRPPKKFCLEPSCTELHMLSLYICVLYSHRHCLLELLKKRVKWKKQQANGKTKPKNEPKDRIYHYHRFLLLGPVHHHLHPTLVRTPGCNPLVQHIFYDNPTNKIGGKSTAI